MRVNWLVRNRAVLLLAVSIGIATVTQSQVLNDVLVKTKGGCSVYIDEATAISLQKLGGTTVWEWNDGCVDGLAQGKGTLVTSYTDTKLNFSTRTDQRQRFYKGKPFGYFKFTNTSRTGSNKPTPSTVGFGFSEGGRAVSFRKLALEGSDELVESDVAPLPKAKFDVFEAPASISDGVLGSLMLMKSPCGLFADRFPDCGFEEGKKNTDVFYINAIPTFGDGKFDPKKITKTYCPQPENIRSCGSIVRQLAEPYVSSILAFIQHSQPLQAERMALLMNSAARQAATSQAAEARAVVQRDVEQRDFSSKLATMPVGELFALADEYKSKGNTARARSALRSLLGRFPNHQFATLAAKMLTEMQEN